jgi:hypothetical protein
MRASEKPTPARIARRPPLPPRKNDSITSCDGLEEHRTNDSSNRIVKRGVGEIGENLVHAARRFDAAGLAYHPCRNSGHGRVARNGVEHHRSGRNSRAAADFDVAQHLGASADQDTVPNLRMAVASFLAGPSERDALEH